MSPWKRKMQSNSVMSNAGDSNKLKGRERCGGY